MWAECDPWGEGPGPGHPGGREELGDQLAGECETGWSVAGLAGSKVPLGEALGEACQPVARIFASWGCIVRVSNMEVGGGFGSWFVKVSFLK